MSKHTPGPWEAKALDPNHFIVHAGDREGSSVAKTLIPLGLDVVTETVRANAKLIAASPDLLEALLKIVRDWDGDPEDMATARAAIEKATP